MKKIYMQPLTEVVKVNAEQMICQSQQLGVGSSVPTGNGNGVGVQSYDDDTDEFIEGLW